LTAKGARPSHIEGSDKSGWILLDYFDFVVHIFAPDTRTFYDLERLWGDAERIERQAPGERRLEGSGGHDRLAGAEDSR
jgi:ribosome-associated protein